MQSAKEAATIVAEDIKKIPPYLVDAIKAAVDAWTALLNQVNAMPEKVQKDILTRSSMLGALAMVKVETATLKAADTVERSGSGVEAGDLAALFAR